MRTTLYALAAFALVLLVSGCSLVNPPPPTEPPVPTKFARSVDATPGAQASPTIKRNTTMPPPAVSSQTPSPIPPPAAKGLKMTSPEQGAQVFMWWRPETADRDVGMAKEAGFTWVKQIFAWRDIEGAGKGKFDWEHADLAVNVANQKGIDLLARLDNAPEWAAPGCFNTQTKTMGPARNTQDWVDFLTAFVKRYQGRIRAYEIWNEPNLAREWCSKPPNPAEYVALLQVSYRTIKAIDPKAMIVSAGLTPTNVFGVQAMPDVTFVERMYDAMKNKSDGYFDVLGVHAAGYKAPPEMSPDDVAKNPTYNHNEGANGRIYAFRHAEDVRKVMVARGDAAKQIAVLEFGWTTDPIHDEYSWFRVDEQTQGKYIVNAFKYAKQNWSPWIGAMFVIYFANPDWTKDNEEYWWSITDPQGNPRAAWVQLKALRK